MYNQIVVILIIGLAIPTLATVEYVLEMQWPATYCKIGKDCRNMYFRDYDNQSWTIHGLWKQTHCRQDTPKNKYFDENKIHDRTLVRLDRLWVGIFSSSTWFRNHEWNKHGVVWRQGDNYILKDHNKERDNEQEQYFYTALELGEYSRVNNSKHDTTQNNGFTLNELMYALRNLKNVQIKCIWNTNQNKQYLRAIWICYDDRLKETNCTNCGSNCDYRYPIYYVPFERSMRK